MNEPDAPAQAPAAPGGGAGVPAASPPPRSLARAVVGGAATAAVSATLITVLAAVVAALVVLGIAAFSLFTETGNRQLLDHVPGVRLSGTQGTVWGPFSADEIDVALPGNWHLVVEKPRWRALAIESLDWRRGVPHLRVADLQAERVRVVPPARRNPNPIVPPDNLVLPFGLDVDQVSVGELQAPGLAPPLRELRFGLHLGSGAGAVHRLDAVAMRWDRLAATGSAEVGADAPVAVSLAVQAAPVEPSASAAAPAAAPPLKDAWAATLTARGTLVRQQLRATVRARDQSLDLESDVAPFAEQPLERIDARARGLDLHALASAAPRTGLTGTLQARLVPTPASARAQATAPAASAPPAPAASAATGAGGAALPVDIDADLRNERAAAWSDGGIPLRSLRLRASGNALDPRRGHAPVVAAEWGTTRDAGGTLQGNLVWDVAGDTPAARRLRLVAEARLADLRPAAIDPRAPAVRLAGPLSFDVQVPLADNPAPVSGSARAQWALRFDARPDLPAAELAFDVEGQPRELAIKQLRARSGDMQLDAAGRYALKGSGAGQRLAVAGQGRFNALDPRPWWPAAGAPAWRQALQRFSGQWSAELDAPLGAGDAAATLAGLVGRAQVKLDEAVVAGLGARGSVQLDAPAGAPAQWRAELQTSSATGGATASAAATLSRGNAEAAGRLQRWEAAWDVPQIAALGPWLELAGAPALAGDLRGQVQGQGQGRDLAGEANLEAGTLQVAGVRLQGLAAQARLAADPQAPLAVQARLARLDPGTGQPQVQALALVVNGSQAAHRIEASADYDLPAPAGAAPAPAPAASANNAALPTAAALRSGRLQLVADGALQRPAADAEAWRWAGQASRLDLGPREADAARWLRLLSALPLRLEAAGARRQVQAGPARLALVDTPVRVDEALVAAADGSAPPRFAVKAALEPLAVAPLLQRWQPGFGWEGDLRVQARVDLRGGADGLQGDIEFSRERGDLVVNDPDSPAGPMALGLTDLRATFAARGGRWQLTQRLAGRQLGSLDGEQTVQAPADALWPPADAPVQGRLDLRGLNLASTLGRWIPPSWRVEGELTTAARLAGRFGAPEFTGELRGRNIAVRNTNEGVDWTGADLALAVQGNQARIEAFEVRAGDGTLTVTGDASFGAEPRADLKLVARRFAALQRVDRRIVASGTTSFVIDPRRLAFTGQLRADEGRIDISRGDAPSLDDDVTVRRDTPGAAETEGKAASPRTGRTQVIDLRLDLGDDFHLRGRGVDTQLVGQARLTSVANRLLLNGTISARDGTYAAYGQKLTIDRGLLIFTGALDNPRLDIEATRSNLDIRVGVAIGGTALNPRVRLFSEPEMADTDKLSWLVLGRAPDGLGRTDLALLQRAAYALVSGERESIDLVRAVGLDELSVRQGDGEVRETVVTLGKQLSRRWYVGYERSLNATAGTWQLIYRAAQRFTLRAQSGVENSLDLIWTWLWK